MLILIFISSCSQILLKRAAGREYKNRISEYANANVIAAYALFASATASSMFILRYMPLSLASALDSCGYVFVAVLSYFILGERISKRKLIGLALIVTGVVLFAL